MGRRDVGGVRKGENEWGQHHGGPPGAVAHASSTRLRERVGHRVAGGVAVHTNPLTMGTVCDEVFLEFPSLCGRFAAAIVAARPRWVRARPGPHPYATYQAPPEPVVPAVSRRL